MCILTLITCQDTGIGLYAACHKKEPCMMLCSVNKSSVLLRLISGVYFRTGKADSPASTPLLPPYARSDKPVTVQPGKLTGQKDGSSRRKESVESWSDESFSQTQSETEHSDIECRVRALKVCMIFTYILFLQILIMFCAIKQEELKRRRSIAERLKKEQKRRHKDRLKAQEASLRSQIEVIRNHQVLDVFSSWESNNWM